jgi:hypothetical protein
MKKIILSALAVCAFGFAQAQDNKDSGNGGKGFTNGDIFISGSLNVSSTKNGDAKTSSFGIMPKVGFFVTDDIAVGGMVGFNSSKDADENKTNTFNVGAFGRWYATPASDFSFMVELGVSYENSKYTDNATDTDYKSSGFGVALSPGVSYFLSDHFAMEAQIAALSFNSQKPDGGDSATSFGLNANLTNVSVGLVYKF